MPEPLSDEALAAIAAYDGPVTVCPPRTFSPEPQIDGRVGSAVRHRQRVQWPVYLRNRRFEAAARKMTRRSVGRGDDA